MLVPRRSRHVGFAACLATMFALAGCGADEPAAPKPATQVRLYGTDGNMLNSFGDEFKEQAGLLDGMKGTTPLTPLSPDFRNRLLAIDPKLGDYLYAGESYDAVVISALAAQLAGTTAPASIARQINGVTTRGRTCSVVSECLAYARNGIDIEYRGVSLRRGGFTDAGEPSTATYATLHFGSSDRLDDGKTEFVGAGNESATTKKQPPAARSRPGGGGAGAPLKIGGLLPLTGDLAFATPPLAAGTALAIREINGAGGVLGKPVQWIQGDDGTNSRTARATVRSHVKAGVHVIIGAGSSSVSRDVLPDVVRAGIVLFSPCNTDAGLSTIDDKGLYFRTAPSDTLQGRALADVILRDGPNKIAIVARKDSYGEGLQGNVRTELERAGIPADRIKLLTYEPSDDPNAPPPDFTNGARTIKEFGADAVLVIGFNESAQIIKALDQAGIQLRH
jgi:ABC-type branched-subunit amino acid transport system substrate-binding protein